jgi:hypothetical protein
MAAGTTGGIGSYTVSINQTVADGTMTAVVTKGGTISAPSCTTQANGQCTVTVSAGAIDQSNRIITVIASSPGATSVMIPLQITGSTVTLSSGSSVLVSGGASTSLTVKALNAGGIGVYNAPVTLTSSGSGSVTIVPSTGMTDVNGNLTVTVTGINSGAATVTATALGATATQSYTVSASGSQFAITSPIANPAGLTIDSGTLPFVVQPGVNTATRIRFSTTIGTWVSCPGAGVNTAICIVSVGTPTATLVSSLAGVANVQVDGLDANDKVIVSDTRQVAMTSATAAHISLQATANLLKPSAGTTSYSSVIMAAVTDANNQPVGNSAVSFALVNTSGGGETLSPVVALSSDGVNSTNPVGQATTTFTSGSLPTSASGDIVRAMIVGSGNGICVANGGTATCADTVINIGGTAGSIAIGQANVITAINSDTGYQLPMTLLVSDSNGNPVPNVVVSLNLWPVDFYTGVYSKDLVTGLCSVQTWSEFPNEDLNANLILNPGEDLSILGSSVNSAAGTQESVKFFETNGKAAGYIADGVLTPANSAAGNVPATVTTDSNGLVTFNLTYLKQYASWINTRLTAKAMVQGTETTSSLTLRLAASVADLSSCNLPSSPYNPKFGVAAPAP